MSPKSRKGFLRAFGISLSFSSESRPHRTCHARADDQWNAVAFFCFARPEMSTSTIQGRTIPVTTEARASLADDFEGNIRKATDDRLTLAAKSGNGSAFVELSRRHSKRIQLRIYRILGNWEDTEDAIQDSLLKAFKHLDQFRGTCKFSTWLMRIAINSALMVLRKRKAHPETSYDSAADSAEPKELWECPDVSAGPERLCVDREAQELLRGAIRRLPWSYRTVLELFYFKDWSTDETAQAMGISIAAAKSRLLRARITLRASLPESGVSTSSLLPFVKDWKRQRRSRYFPMPSRHAHDSCRSSERGIVDNCSILMSRAAMNTTEPIGVGLHVPD